MSEIIVPSFVLTEERMEEYLAEIKAKGVSEASIVKYRTPLKDLYLWLGDEKYVTRERLCEWRKNLESRNCAQITVQTYVTTINTFLRFCCHEELCIPRPMKNDLTGQTFGYLTAISLAGKNNRRNIVWKCRCKCGNEIDVPATLLINMNTTSCGCLKGEQLQYANRYVEGTSLRQTLADDSISKRTASGYTGVYQKRGKWIARIQYKGVLYSLGSYFKKEDAVKARAMAKELIKEDAQVLFDKTSHLYGKRPMRPSKPTHPVA